MDNNVGVALISAIFGGAGIKLVEYFLITIRGRQEGNVTLEAKKLDDAVLIRKELRQEVGELKMEITDLYKRLDESRERYYDLLQKHNALQAQYNELKIEHDELKETVDSKA